MKKILPNLAAMLLGYGLIFFLPKTQFALAGLVLILLAALHLAFKTK